MIVLLFKFCIIIIDALPGQPDESLHDVEQQGGRLRKLHSTRCRVQELHSGQGDWLIIVLWFGLLRRLRFDWLLMVNNKIVNKF